MSVLPVVERLSALARDPATRSAIANDATMLAGLGQFLENDDPAVVNEALDTMDHLAASPGCSSMFHDAVKKQMIYGRTTANKKKAQAVFMKLQKYSSSAAPAAATSAKKPLGEITNTKPLPHRKPRHAVNARTTHTFNIPELTDELRDEIEIKMLGVPGVLSFTMDVEAGTLTLRATEEDGEVLKRKLFSQYDIPVEMEGKHETTPDYLPENDDSNDNTSGWGSWLVGFGAQPKKTQREKQQASSWAPWTSGLKTVGQGLGVL
jgi:hypothetical protein